MTGHQRVVMIEMAKTTVYLLDDQAMIRAAFRHWLSQADWLTIVGEQGNPRTAIHEIADIKPDIVLLDIAMPELSGLDAIPLIRDVAPQARIVMMTNHEGECFVRQAIDRGASGYLCKDSDPDELVTALRAVRGGTRYVSPKAGAQNPTAPPTTHPETQAANGLDALTPREREVFLLLAMGRSNKEVAREFHISLGTAKKHRENLQRKLDCHSPADLARLAIREGLLPAK